MTNKLIVILLFSTIQWCFGQKNFLPGYTVDNSGDTIRGLINYKHWDTNPTRISFKENSTSTLLEFGPREIRAFSVSGEIYISATVEIETSSAKISELSTSSAPKYERSLVFLQVLFNGEKKLFLFNDKYDKNLFFIDQGGIKPLLYKQYIADIKQQSIGENKAYLGMLAFYLQDCPDIQSKVKGTSYNSSSLVSIFKYYYQCVNKSAAYVNDRKDTKIEVGLIGGVTLSTLTFHLGYTTYDYLTRTTYSISTDPTFGFYIDFKLLRSTGFKISNDLLYTSFSVKSENNSLQLGTNYTSTVNASFKYSYIKTHHMLQYNLLKDKLYLGGGGTFGILLSQQTSTKINYSTGLVSDQVFKSSSPEFGWVAGIGSRIGKFSLNARYEGTTGISQEASTDTYRFYFLLRYSLSK